MEFVGKCLFIEELEKKILVVGDLHLGWEESLNRTGVFVSRKLFEENLEYLDKVFEKTGNIDEVVLLGDVKHEFGTIIKQEWNDVSSLFDYLLEKTGKVVIVKGNHDVILEPIVKKYKKVELKDYYIVGKICFMHGDKDFVEIYSKEIQTWILGHAHPAIKISEPGGAKVEKYKCFLVGKFNKKNIVIVPSFFEGNAGSDPRENDFRMAWEFNLKKFNVKIVNEENLEVLDFGKLGKMS
ncbi:MAG: metallophosphoesterase [Nanoarchaeota archaeon]|nr:metallophosphoesterase [Nanoarchaeota archaeon]